MNTLLWIDQGLLALVFLFSGALKLARTKRQLEIQLGWVKDFSQAVLRLIGVVEILGAAGLIVPGLIHFQPLLTPLAACVLVLLMAGAAVMHFRRNESSSLGTSIALLLLSALVVVGRLWISPL